MLLGIVLHGLLSFIPLPIWPAQDIHQNEDVYGLIIVAIHGFRMPLFFLISGFFTAMMWKSRGLKGLLKHRFQRIGFPLVVFGAILFPMVNHVGKLNEWKEDTYKASQQQPKPKEKLTTSGEVGQPRPFFEAAKAGDLSSLSHHIGAGISIDSKDDIQFTALHWAASLGHEEVVTLLLEHGADLHSLDGHSSTPLHITAFLGQPNVARILLEHGADPTRKNQSNHTPLHTAKTQRDMTEWIASDILKIPFKWETIKAGRTEVVSLLGGKPSSLLSDWFNSNYRTHGKFYLHHLWFLYDLLWLVAGFSALIIVPSNALFKNITQYLAESPLRLLWLVPITCVPQYFMQDFGPDTSVELKPNFIKLSYYFIFFAYGAACYGRPGFTEKAGRYWPFYFLAALPVLIIGILLYEKIPQSESTYKPLAALCSATYAWLMILGFIGFFRKFFAAENLRVRYVSDSAYWLYLAHLPLTQALQIWMSDWYVPSLIKIIMICVLTTGTLLLMYEYLIRYTPAGTLLNGKRKRPLKISQG